MSNRNDLLRKLPEFLLDPSFCPGKQNWTSLSRICSLGTEQAKSEFLIMSLLKIIAYSYTADVGALVEEIYVGVRVAVAGYEIGEKFIITEWIE